jgi:hypothetical protein
MTQPVWYGTQLESETLVRAIANNCTCEFNASGARRSTCAPHQMLTNDQRALNGLLFVRKIREQLLREEWRQGRTKASRGGGPTATVLSNR